MTWQSLSLIIFIITSLKGATDLVSYTIFRPRIPFNSMFYFLMCPEVLSLRPIEAFSVCSRDFRIFTVMSGFPPSLPYFSLTPSP